LIAGAGSDRAMTAGIKTPMKVLRPRRRGSAVTSFHGLALLAASLVVLAVILSR
jgi:hypothetical protein